MGGGPIVCDCMLSAVKLEAGSDKWCGLPPSCLDVGQGGMGVIPTAPDERVLGRGSVSTWGGCSCMVSVCLEEERFAEEGFISKTEKTLTTVGSSIILSGMGFRLN